MRVILPPVWVRGSVAVVEGQWSEDEVDRCRTQIEIDGEAIDTASREGRVADWWKPSGLESKKWSTDSKDSAAKVEKD
ncbi:hypothetical protein BJ742DRAFT_778941 [Cladochytrium replicatum]|nr:hypothetical protein BJ742DRAFT_778941 [Cladochytrium replicatum]